MEKVLRLKTYVDGGINDTSFPNEDNPIEVGAFRYDAKRMGGAPTITASVYYPSCLDDEWTDKVYAEFNGEKYYLKQTPTSSYNNESTMYKHDLELVSERIILDNVYFFDTVVGDPQGDDKPVSNSTKVVFFSNINEFVARLNSSLEYSGLDYTVIVDDDDNITKEEKLMSFEDQFFSNVLQEIYNTYEVPYYFEGKTIHIGYSNSNAVVPTFSYGVDNALLSITKNNANYKIVNRATATGSSDNIPFYYPNNSPKGNIEAKTNRSGLAATILDYEKYSNAVKLDQAVKYVITSVSISSFKDSDGRNVPTSGYSNVIECDYTGRTDEYTIDIYANKESNIELTINPVFGLGKVNEDGSITEGAIPTYSMRLFANGKQVGSTITDSDTNKTFGFKTASGTTTYTLYVKYSFEYTSKKIFGQVGFTSYSMTNDSTSGWYLGNKEIELSKLGIKANGTPQNGDTITQKLIEYIKTSDVLMPYRYRVSSGDERFYNAINYPYPKPEGFDDTLLNGYYGEDGILRNPLGEYEVEGYIHNDAYKNEDETHTHFNAPFVEGHPKEHIFTVEDIKPTIKETIVNSLRIDMFSEFAYDTGDNDETYEDEEGNVYFKHPYFYGKLRVMDFNLFDHAIEQQPMTISFTSGHCGACNFEIGVTEDYPQKNPVQVDEYGNLVRDENGMVLAGVEGTQQLVTTFQERQQDTSKYEVWIALRKEESTYGILMPQVAHRPKAAKNEDGTPNNEGDTFVILGINLPQSYILNAEKKLEAEIIKYLQDNNDEKFTFSIGFSRIYFEENNILDQLSENSKIAIMYNGQRYDLYVSSFSYSMSEGDVLPEIRVELDETLKISQNALQNAINQVKSELGRAIGNIDVVGASTPYFIRKDADDEARGTIDFKKGIKFGEGGKVEVMDNNSAKLTIEYLEVTKKATFTSLEVQEKTHVGGQILVTPASMNCGEVEEFDDFYRCYFQTKGAEGGDEIFNQFVAGDQAICQTFNTWGSRYYWRLVVGVGEDYIDLSKADYDEGSGVPEAGDKIIQMGNRNDEARQNAIIIAAHGDNSPYIVQYKGISNFDLPKTDNDERITTLLSPTKNILTGQVRMTAGSSGLEMFEEWASKQELIDSKASSETLAGFDYLKEALKNDTTIVGGLIQSSILSLGYTDEEGIYHIMSGTNGVYDANATGGGIAAWYGGAMSEDLAKTVLRFDGSGFFANKNITWDNEGGASFANGKITITKEGALVFSDNIAFGSEENETVASIIEKLSTVLSYFSLKGGELTTEYQLHIKNNLVIDGDEASTGNGEDNSKGTVRGIKVTSSTTLYPESDGIINMAEFFSELSFDVDLSGYYTSTQVDALLANGYVAKGRKITAGNGLSGGGDLSADRTISLATVGTAGTYAKVVVDAYGRVTGSASLVANDIPTIAISKVSGLQPALDAKVNLAGEQTITGSKTFSALATFSNGMSIKGDVTIDGNLFITGDEASMGDGGSGTGGGIDEAYLAAYLYDNDYIYGSINGGRWANNIFAPISGGTSGYVLVSDGTSSAPVWKSVNDLGISGGAFEGGYIPNTVWFANGQGIVTYNSKYNIIYGDDSDVRVSSGEIPYLLLRAGTYAATIIGEETITRAKASSFYITKTTLISQSSYTNDDDIEDLLPDFNEGYTCDLLVSGETLFGGGINLYRKNGSSHFRMLANGGLMSIFVNHTPSDISQMQDVVIFSSAFTRFYGRLQVSPTADNITEAIQISVNDEFQNIGIDANSNLIYNDNIILHSGNYTDFISGGSGADLSNYYNKEESDERFINKYLTSQTIDNNIRFDLGSTNQYAANHISFSRNGTMIGGIGITAISNVLFFGPNTLNYITVDADGPAYTRSTNTYRILHSGNYTDYISESGGSADGGGSTASPPMMAFDSLDELSDFTENGIADGQVLLLQTTSSVSLQTIFKNIFPKTDSDGNRLSTTIYIKARSGYETGRITVPVYRSSGIMLSNPTVTGTALNNNAAYTLTLGYGTVMLTYAGEYWVANLIA